MPAGLNLPKPTFSTTNVAYSPTGSSGDPLSGAIQKLPSTIVGKLKGLWQSIRGNAKPERSVVEAGPGDYRLQRKGQPGYERLNILGKAPAQPRATYASPEGARVRVVPSQATTATSIAPSGSVSGSAAAAAVGPAPLTALIDKILSPQAAAPASAASATTSINQAFDRLVSGSTERRDKEAALLGDLDQLVRLADAAGESLRPTEGAPRSEATKAFDTLVGKLLALNVGGSGAVLRKLADTDASPAGLRDAAYRHAAGSSLSAAASPGVRVKLAVADGLLGHASRYDPPASDLKGLSPGDRMVLKTSRLREAERDTGEALASASKSVGDSMLSLHRSGALDATTLKPLRDFQPLAAMSQSASRAAHVGALPLLAEILASVAKGSAGTVNLLTAGDSRHDALALKLKTIGLAEGSPAHDKAVLQHTLSRAKYQLASVWTQQEKVSRITGSSQALGGMGKLGTRMSQVINAGGSDQLRVNAQLLRVLREGPAKDVAAREAAARGGAGIQADARAGKDVNLLIAQVMLLQKHLDAQDVGNQVQDSQDKLQRHVSALPAALQAKLGDAMTDMALPAGERPAVIALGLAKPETFALFTQAFSAEREHADAVQARARLAGGNDETRAQAAIDLTGDNGVYTGLVKDMNAVPQTAPSSAPLTTATRLDAVIDHRALVATAARDQLATALGCEDLSDVEMRALGDTLQGIHALKAAEQTARQVGEDGSLGLSDKDFIEMGFSAAETAQVKQELSTQLGAPIEALFRQGLSSTADAKKVTDAVNNGIDRLFVKGTSSLTQSTMRDVAKAFPEAAARQYLAAVLDAAHPVHGAAAQAGPDAVFGGIFGDTLSSPDKPLSRLLQKTGAQVTAAQAHMTKLVGELSSLDDGAAVARKVLDAIATPTRKFDPSSDSAKANATRLASAATTLDELDAADALLAASAEARDTHITQTASDKQLLQAERTGASQALATTQTSIVTMRAALDKLDTELAQVGDPSHESEQLEMKKADIDAELGLALARESTQQATLQFVDSTMAETDADNAARLSALVADVASHTQTRDGLQNRLDDQIKTVRWMNPSTLERSIRPQDRITTTADLRAFLDKADNRSAMTALHTLHALPAAKEGKLQQITDQAAQADLALSAHRAALTPSPGAGIDPGQLQGAIRFAMLETALAWPDGPGSFDPTEHRGAIEARLQQWGLDSNVIRPEIDAVLHQHFDLAQVEDWTKDAEQAFKAPVQPAPGMARRALDAARTFVTDNSPLDTATRRSLLDGVRSMRVGDSLGLSRGLSWGLDTTATPVEATGTLTAQVVVDIKSKNAMEVRRTEQGVEIVFKAGMQGAGALGIGATLFGAAKITAQGKGGHESLAGAGFRFTDPEAAAKFLDTVLDGKKISPRTWALAQETAVVSDRATTLGGTLDAKATAKNLMAKVPGSEVVAKYLVLEGEVAGSGFEFLGGVQAKVGASREWRTEQQQNASGHVVEKSRTTVIEGSISVGIWASLPTIQDSVIDHFVDSNPVYTAIDNAVNSNRMMEGVMGAKAKDYGAPDNHVFDPFSPASVKQFSLNLSAKRTLGEASSLAFERDGLLSARGNTMTRSVVVTGRAGDRDLAMLQPGFSSKSARSRGDDSLFNAVTEMRKGGEPTKMLDELLASAKPGTTLSVTYALKDGARLIINDMIKTAERAEKSGDLDHARTLGELAKSMYEDEKNYEVDTIQVGKQSKVDNSTTLASVGIMAIGRVSEGSAERPTMILAMPGGPTARGMAAEHARTAPPTVLPGDGPGTVISSDAVAESGVGPGVDLAPSVLAEADQVAADSGQQADSDASLAPSGDAVHSDTTSAASAPAVLVNVEVLEAEVQADAVQIASVEAQVLVPVGPPVLSDWDRRLVDRFEAAVLPALEPVPRASLYVENQHASACGIHSINAFVGGQAFDIPSFTSWIRDTTAAFMPASEQDVLEPESAATGISPQRVTRALELLQDSPAMIGKAGAIGNCVRSAPGADDRLGRVTLPPLGNTDRLILEVNVSTQEREDIGAHPLDHFVAFRKDDQGAWWLLDSRSAEVDAPLSVDGNAGARSQQIDPGTWLNEIATHAKLKTVALIGPGITGHDLTVDVTTTQPIPRQV